jgi:hypothetical protein
LAESLELWNQLTHRIAHLETQNQAWEFRSNPEREDRNWWNPFWRSSAERNLQRSNELSLQLRELEKQRTYVETNLLEQSTLYTNLLMETPPKPNTPEYDLWVTLDAWRFPLWLKHFEEIKKSVQQLHSLNPELRTHRHQALEAAFKTAKMLERYLLWRKNQSLPSNAQNNEVSQKWQEQIQTWLHESEPLLNQH